LAIKSEKYLIISDLQIPFEAEKALEFCQYIAKHFRIPASNIYNVGDEVDQYFGGAWAKDPDAWHTPNSELEESIHKLTLWYKAFPKMKICTSNHGMRWARKAAAAEIPSQMIRKYQDVLHMPKGWVHKDEWRIKTRHPFRIIHGMGYSGQRGACNAAIDAGISTAIGHLHSHGGINFLHTMGRDSGLNNTIWAMNTSSLIDEAKYAFQYGKYNRNKATLGIGAVFNSGALPVLFPYDL